MFQRRIHLLCLALTLLFLIVSIDGERARNDYLQDDFVDDGSDEVIETIKRFLTKKKDKSTTTKKPGEGGAISALVTTTKASAILPNRSPTSSRIGPATKSPITTKDACGMVNPCKNGGTCKTLSTGRYYCFCGQDYYGKNCENKFISTGAANRDRSPTDHCAKNPCRNNGECVGLRTTFYCRCKSPHYGTTCEKKIGKRELIDSDENYQRELEEDRDDLRRALAEELM